MLGHVPLAIIGAAPAPPTLTSTCGNDPGLACRLAWDLSHSAQAAQVTDNYLSGPIHLALRVAFVVLLALVIRALLHRLINRVTERATQAVLLPFRNPLPGGSVLGAVRRVPRRRPPVDEDPAVTESTLAENTVAGGRSSGRCALASRPPWTPPGSPRPLSSPEPRWSPITRHPRRRPRPGRGATVVPATIPEWIGWEAP